MKEGLLFCKKEAKNFYLRCRGPLRKNPRQHEQKFFGSFLQKRTFLLFLALTAPAKAEGLRIFGLVRDPQTFTIDQLKAMPPRHVAANFTTMHGQDNHIWTGVLLFDLVAKCGLKDEPGPRTGMRHVLMVTGQDGYAAAFAIGEIDPFIGDKSVLLAYHQDDPPKDLPTLKVIVPGDKHGARAVHDVVSIEVR
jgi:DMSO/TMAO reductase YedYZ molybdopterin-dependent catalytic subunit